MDIIIDTDPGIDDAVAIAIALFNPNITVKLVTTVAGNVGIEAVTRNALTLCNFYEQAIPIAKGAAYPLIEPLVDASQVHGTTGLEGYEFTGNKNHTVVLDTPAVEAMRSCILESPDPITLVPIAPLTNIALLISQHPEVKANIERIVLMGGSLTRGNKGVMSEFNIATDPEAAHIVFTSGLPIVMIGLDIGMKALVKPEHSEQIKTMNKVGNMFYSLFKKYRGGSFTTGLRMYDSTAIAYLLDPEMFTTIQAHVAIELTGTYTRGATIVDLKNYLKREANCTVCTDIDSERFISFLMSEIKNISI